MDVAGPAATSGSVALPFRIKRIVSKRAIDARSKIGGARSATVRSNLRSKRVRVCSFQDTNAFRHIFKRVGVWVGLVAVRGVVAVPVSLGLRWSL